jgi:hypothetical protein
MVVGVMVDGTPSAWERDTEEEAVNAAYEDVVVV